MSEIKRLTIEAINAIGTPAKGRVYVRDSQVKGLRIVVTDHGSRSWYWVGKVRGRSQSIRLGDWPSVPIERARREAQRILSDIADGRTPVPVAKRAANLMTLGNAHRWFIDNYSRPHKASWRKDQLMFDRYFADWRHMALSEITRADVKRRHIEYGATRGKAAANEALKVLFQVYKSAIRDQGYRGENPAQDVPRFASKSRERFLLPEELPRFFDGLRSLKSKTARDVLLLCLLTGARRSNVVSMEWAEIDEANAVWVIPADKTKKRRRMSIVLVPDALAILESRKQTSLGRFVFPSTGSTGHYAEPKHAWKRLCDAAGLTGVTIHDLRRTFASYQAANNASLQVIAQSLGQSSTSSTSVYARLQVEGIRGSVEKAVNAIMTLANPPEQEPSQAQN